MMRVGDRVRIPDIDWEHGGACGEVVQVVRSDDLTYAAYVVRLDGEAGWAAVPMENAEPMVPQ